MTYHKPVLADESVSGLNIKPAGSYADLTFGGGGHSKEILKNLNKKGKLIAFDQDPDAINNINPDPRFIFAHANFRFLRNFLRYHNIGKLDGILADMGISSHQIDTAERGFSYLKEAKLDMRMNAGSGKTAAAILNEYSKEELMRVFKEYGEYRKYRELSAIIIKRRSLKAFSETADFIEAIEKLLPKMQEKKFLSMIFQALRIEVNDELGALKEMLVQTTDLMNGGGRLVVLTYHSLEDRLVKNFIKSGNMEGRIEKDFYGNVQVPFKAVNKSVIRPSEKEIELNKRARSAKLRIAEKI